MASPQAKHRVLRALVFLGVLSVPIAAPACSFSHGRRVTASVGIASLPEDVVSADDLIRAADEALYAAKRAGKNRIAAYGEVGAARPAAHEAPVA